jgi:photosynthetic reaction center H subunit
MEPEGDPLAAGIGPGSYAERSDHPELSEDGKPAVIPMRAGEGYTVNGGPDPRGFSVVGSDGEVAGKVTDIWVDRADQLVRYLEMEMEGGAPVQAVENDDTKVEAGDDGGDSGDKAEDEGGEESSGDGEAEDAGDSGAAGEDAAGDAPEAAANGNPHARLIPISMLSVDADAEVVTVKALKAAEFANVPALKAADSVTLLEEERVSAYYVGGFFYGNKFAKEPIL